MKKTLILAVILGLLLPAAAFAATEFSLGGFIKLDAFWDSTQQGKNINGVINRNNDGAFHHGQTRFTAQGSRFNFTIKGPKVFGAQTTGFIEMDFDQQNGPDTTSASSVYTPRLRHAMFRLNWPETELLMGQYWSIFCSWYIESAEDGPFQVVGTPTARIPQIRLTQKFLGDWSVMGLIGMANSLNAGTGPLSGAPYSANSTSGSAAETPQIQASMKYEHDWWGKAAYYGVPTPFTAQLTGGWQRNTARTQNVALSPISENLTAFNGRISNKTVDPWMAMGTLFIPVIPTHSANLAGTAHLLAQFWIGQGVSAFGFNGDQTSVFKFNANAPSVNPANDDLYDIELLKRWGGMVEAQYYFNNQWYANLAWGISKTYGVNQEVAPDGTQTYLYNNVNAQFSTQQQIDFTVWYRPVTALKFGLQYAFVQDRFWTNLFNATTNLDGTTNGTAHRIEFAGYFYF